MVNYKIEPFSQYILRTPLFPITFYSDLTDNYSEEKLLHQLQNKYVREAISLASPELLAALDKWKLDPIKISDKKKHNLELSFLKYLARMSARCTPFGLFSGCGVGKITSQTHIVLEDPEMYSRHTQFDMQFWVALLQDFANKKEVIPYLKYFPNNSIYALGDFYRYVEYKYVETKREHNLSAIRKSDLLNLILTKSKSGLTIYEMSVMLADDDSELDDALEYITHLIDFQFLVSELDATVTEKNEWERVFTILNQIPGLSSTSALLQKIKEQLSDLDSNLTPSLKKQQLILKEINKLEVKYHDKYLFQTDLYTFTTENELNNVISKKVLQAIRFLNGIQKPNKLDNQVRFIKAFNKRYEFEEMPLTTVLDTETGIGYVQNQEMNDTHELLDKFSFNNKSLKESKPRTEFDFILEYKLKEAILNGETVLSFFDEDFPEFDANWKNTPSTFSVIIECIKKDEKEIISIEPSGNISAAKLLGRFCNGNTLIHGLTNEIIEKENEYYSDKILAEIVHIPESRTGNILKRPALRDYEITYLSNSGVDKDFQIGLDDLMISIKNNTIVLRSKKLKKEVIPCLSNAHNYAHKSLPIYHFLADLQSQNLKPIYNFSWGVLETQYQYFPRVIYKDIILSKAKWHLTKNEIEPFYLIDASSLFVLFTEWRIKKNIPRFANWVHFDNTLLLDFEQEIGVRVFLKSVHKFSNIILEEFLFTEESIVKNKNGDYFSNQIIMSFYKKQI
ncbi:lantibiotic dehydratase family protein [Flavobacterium sp. MDT1-60]|uniref:lantibiotic dehydratase family protein n=1 Tax=Flavobacterium sp. MDT1-60 TaxID=1979344 RepID=UPI001784103C|nr:lantibiotic dehydratase family protein [Flavobacterium sp. MDT1-60]QOG02313.1 lantibiotic dehydratase family protein [Flavobacterium sp. MDT1-60]